MLPGALRSYRPSVNTEDSIIRSKHSGNPSISTFKALVHKDSFSPHSLWMLYSVILSAMGPVMSLLRAWSVLRDGANVDLHRLAS